MKTVNRMIIDKWVNENGPDGVWKLANKAKVSRHTLSKIRLGYVPRSELIRDALSNALEVKESELFPVNAEKTKAS